MLAQTKSSSAGTLIGIAHVSTQRALAYYDEEADAWVWHTDHHQGMVSWYGPELLMTELVDLAGMILRSIVSAYHPDWVVVPRVVLHLETGTAFEYQNAETYSYRWW